MVAERLNCNHVGGIFFTSMAVVNVIVVILGCAAGSEPVQ